VLGFSSAFARARRPSAAIAVIIAAAGSWVGASPAAAATTTHRPAASACAAPGSTYTHTAWSPAPYGQPGQIAPFGHLQAGQSVTLTDTALNAKKVCVPGVTVYVNLEVNVPGDSLTIPAAQCGGNTVLSSAPVACTTDANGQVTMTYTAPSVIPAYGNVEINDCISMASERQCQSGRPNNSISWRSWYQYLMTYSFTRSPIAAAASLSAGQSVGVSLLAAGVDGTPQPATPIYLSLQSTAAQQATVTVVGSGTPLTSTPQQFMTDATGTIGLSYTAPSLLPASGVDTIVAQSDTTSQPQVSNEASYAYSTGYPTVSVGDVTTTEGDNHPNITAMFEVTLSAAQGTPVTLKYFTICGVGDKECGEDILQVKTPKTLTIPAGLTEAVIPITVYSYSSLEPYNETYLVQITAPTGAVLGRSIGTGELLGDDETTLAEYLYMGGSGVVVGSGTQTARVVVVLSSPAGADVSFQYATSDGSAMAGVDYTAESGTTTITAGSTQATILIPILPDASPGPTRIFTIGMSNVAGPAAIRLATGLVSIMNIS
jgi:hypothetical protein